MVDLPQHVAQITMFKAVLDGTWPFRDLVQINSFMPNLLPYGLIWLLSQVFSVLTATKLVLSIGTIGLPMAMAHTLRGLRIDPVWAWLTLPLCYGFSFIWGQINFIFAIPIGILFIDLTYRYSQMPTLRMALVLAVLVHLLFYTHILILFFAGTIGGLFILLHAPSLWRALIRVTPLLAVGPIGLTWGLGILDAPHVQSETQWELGWVRFYMMPEILIGMPLSLSSVFVCLALFLLPLIGGLRFSRNAARYVPLALCGLIVFGAPNSLAGDFFIFHRFGVFLFPLFMFCLERSPESTAQSRSARLAVTGAVVMALAWVAFTGLRADSFDKESGGFNEIVQLMEQDKRVMSLVFEPGSRFSPAPVFLHYPVWYQEKKGGLVDFSFASFGQLVGYRENRLPAVDSYIVWRPGEIDWEHHHGGMYDYVIVRARSQDGESPLNLANCQIALLLNKGLWWLYAVDGTAPQRPGCGPAA